MGEKRASILAGIRESYPQMPALLAELLTDARRNFSSELRCEVIDWFAAGPDGVKPEVRDTALRFQNACALPVSDLTPEVAAARLGETTLAVDVDGDVVTMIARAGDTQPMVCCSLQVDLARLGEGPYWAARLRLKEIDQAMLLLFLDDPESTAPFGAPEARLTWRGAYAPSQPRVVEPRAIKGTFKHLEIESAAMGHRRRVSVYLPPGWSHDREWPVVFMADNGAQSYFTQVEAMILDGEIAPVILIGVGSGEGGMVTPDPGLSAKLRDVRSADYLPGWDGAGDRFDRHLAFFADEVTAWASETYGASRRREQRMVTGSSNGAVFALNAGLLRPDVFGFAASLSPGWRTPAIEDVGDRPRAIFRVSGGLYEPPFHDGAKRAEARLKAAGYDVIGRYPAAGHFHDQWSVMLREALLEFAPRE